MTVTWLLFLFDPPLFIGVNGGLSSLPVVWGGIKSPHATGFSSLSLSLSQTHARTGILSYCIPGYPIISCSESWWIKHLSSLAWHAICRSIIHSQIYHLHLYATRVAFCSYTDTAHLFHEGEEQILKVNSTFSICPFSPSHLSVPKYSKHWSH